MALSLSKVFKKEKASSEQDKSVQAPVVSEDKTLTETKSKSNKHGAESGVCCGSCS